MAVNPLDVNTPTLTSPSIELTDELRAIKTRLVADKSAIEQLQQTLVDVGGITSFGAELLASTDPDDARGILDFTAFGITLVELADIAALKSLLSVPTSGDYTPTISIGVNKFCITLPGGIKINMITGAFSDQFTHTWQTAFTSTIYGLATTLRQNSNDTVQVYNETNTQVSVSFNGGGTKSYSVIAIGI